MVVPEEGFAAGEVVSEIPELDREIRRGGGQVLA